MKKRLIRRIITVTIILTFIFLWSAFLYLVHPEEIVKVIGVRNGYFASFFISVFGEAATFSFVSVYPAIITLSISGLNPHFRFIRWCRHDHRQPALFLSWDQRS